MIGMTMPLAALLLAATANFPCGSYVYTGGIKNFRNRLVESRDGAELRIVRSNDTVLATSTVTDPTSAGINFRLEVPLSVRATAATAATGDRLNVVLLHDGQVAAMAPLPPVGTSFGSTNFFMQVVAMTSFTNLVTDAVVQVPDDYLNQLSVYMEYYGKGVYDPWDDWDGDGVSNYEEYLCGTNPFDSSECLRIRSFKAAGNGCCVLTFEYTGGRVYALSAAQNLMRPDWMSRSFRPESRTAAEQQQFVFPDSPDGETGLATIYLTPVSPTNEFFRIKLQ